MRLKRTVRRFKAIRTGTKLAIAWKLVPPAMAMAGAAVAIGWVVARQRTTTRRLGLPPLETVSELDLKRYLGTWYEIARFPHRFERRCTGTTATYSQREDRKIEVVNRCYLDGLDGEVKRIQGVARVADKKPGAGKLQVQFFWPLWGDYWVLEVGKDYEYAVVGHPSRDYLWILSRTPTMDPETYEGILERLRAQHYPVERLQKTVQPPPEKATIKSSTPPAIPVANVSGRAERNIR